MKKYKILTSLFTIVILILCVIAIFPKKNKSETSVVNIKPNEILAIAPSNLILSKAKPSDVITLKYSSNGFSKTLTLNLTKEIEGKQYFNLPLLPVGDFEVYTNGIKNLGFKINYYPDKNDIETCYSLRADQNLEMKCYKQFFLSNVSDRESVLKSLADLLIVANKEGEGFTCHIYAHYIGESSVFVFDSLEKAITNPFVECEKGYIHGALKSYVDVMSLDELKKVLPSICNQFPEGISDCIHGLGHNLYFKSVNDVQEAFSNCLIYDNKLWANECAAGVSMSLGWDMLDKEPDLVKTNPDFVNETCSKTDNKIKDGCYRFIMLVYNNLANDPQLADKLYSVCEDLKGDSLNYCASASSAEYAVIGKEVNRNDIVNYCLRFGKSDVFKDCITGAIFKRFISDGEAVAESYCKAIIQLGINKPKYCDEWKLLEDQRAKDYGNILNPTISK